MQPVLEKLPRDARVAVVRLRSMGDCVLTTPAIFVLGQGRPDLRIAVVVENRFRGIFEGNPAIETLLAPHALALRRWHPELCLNLHGGSRSAWLTAVSGARFRAGFAHFRFPWLYNVRIPRAQEILGEERKVHTAEHIASAMFFLGAPRTEIPRARLFAAPPTSGRPYAVIHAFAAAGAKTWRPEGFRAVAERLRASGIEPIFIGGPGDDLAPFAGFRPVAGAPPGELKSLLSGASLFVGNDSGPAHIAAAFGVPVVVLFGSSDVDVWRPWKTPAQVLTAPGGIQDISEAQVLEALERLRVAA